MPAPARPIPSSVIAITGGARGIGRATAAALVREGGHVAIGDVDGESARATAEELGPLASAYELDVTDRASFADFLGRVEGEVGPVDVLVNNAGIMPLGAFVDESDETARRMVDINVHGVMLGMKEAIPRMLARGSGHVINIASGAGKAGYPGGATYCATKHAVVGVTEAVAAELRETAVEVTAVFPAVVNTELASGLSPTRGVKVSEPEDVAEAIVRGIAHPRPEVFVPRSLGPLSRLMGVLPRRARMGIARAMRTDTVLARIDERQRTAYDERISGRPPGAAAPPTGAGNGAAQADDPPAGGDPVGAATETGAR